MDKKFIDALLASLTSQRESALNEAAKLNASLILATAERDEARSERDAMKAAIEALQDGRATVIDLPQTEEAKA